MENIPEYLKWIIGIILTSAGTLGIGKLLENRATRKYQLEDKHLEISQSNQAQKYAFDQYSFQKIAERLEKVETKLDDVQRELSDTKEKLARSDEANKYLKETNERQEKELVALREDRRILSGQVNSLTGLVSRLQTQIEALQKKG